MSAVLSYQPMVSQETILEMAQEKVLEDADLFADWLCAECMAPTERRPSVYFALISTRDLVTGILMKTKASDQQLAEGVRELRRRFLEDQEDHWKREFQRILAESDQ